MESETTPGTMAEADAALVTGSPEVVEAPAAEPAGQPEGPARDAQGRFTETPTAEPETPEGEGAAPTDETPGEPTEAAAEDEAAEDYPSFTYRADGQDFDIPGSAVGEDGVFIPQEQLPEVQQLLSAGKAAFGSVRQRLGDAAQQVQSERRAREAVEANLQTVLGKLESMIEASQGMPLEQSPMGQWLLNAAQNWAVLKAEGRAVGLEKQQQAQKEQLQRYQQQEEQQRIQPLMQQTLEQGVLAYGQEAGLDQAAMVEVFRSLQEPHHQVFVRAPYDDPAAGIKQGELVIDYGVVQAEVSRAARWLQQFGRPQEKIAKAVAANAQVEPKAKIPPTVGGKGRAPKAGAGFPSFKSAKEADEFLLHGNLDDIEVE